MLNTSSDVEEQFSIAMAHIPNNIRLAANWDRTKFKRRRNVLVVEINLDLKFCTK